LNTDAGINYSYDGEKWGVNIGVAGFHLARNKQGVQLTGSYSNNVRYATNASVIRKFKGGDELHLIARYDHQGLNKIYTAGSIYKLKIPGEHPIEKLNMGILNRLNNGTFCPFLGFEAPSWFAGFSYDVINSSYLTANNTVQSLELTFGWQVTRKKSKLTHKRMVIY